MKLVEEQHRRQVRGSLLEWCTEVLAPIGQAPARHHRLIIGALEQVARGEIDRLMIYMPPGHAKSTYATVLFPAWWFTQHPRSAIICASHTSDLAESFGRRVRNLVDQHAGILGFGLSRDSQAAGKWDTSAGGEYLAAGVGKAIAGRRADLAIIDDPVASRESVESEGERDRAYNWYRGDLYDRLKPRARVILIMTRWHEDDLGGRLDLDEMNGEGDRWHRLLLPAIAETEDDLLGRKIGEALWPEEYSAEVLERKRRVVGEREFIAKYQQRPTPPGGAIFHPDQIEVVDAIPPVLMQVPDTNVVQMSAYARSLRAFRPPAQAPMRTARCRAWDLSAPDKIGTRDPDWTRGLLMCRTGDGRWWIESIVSVRGNVQESEALILQTAQADAMMYGEGEVLIHLPQDPGQAGKSQVQALTRMLAGHRVTKAVSSGDKAMRASPVAAQVNVGNVRMIRAPWNKALRDELAAFPNGTHDDIVDALSSAFSHLLPPRDQREVAPVTARRLVPSIYGR